MGVCNITPTYKTPYKILTQQTKENKMEKEKVIIDVWDSEDGYELIRVYLAYKSIGEYIVPNNLHNAGFFLYDIDEDYLKEWDIVEDYRTE
jgi:hypothetical protein